MSEIDIKKLLLEKKPDIDKIIEKWIPRKFDKNAVISNFGLPSYEYNVEAINKAISDPVWNFLDRGGKRWRPVLFLLMSEALGVDPEKFSDLVLLPEMLHNGCLTRDSFILENPGEQVKITEVQKGDNIFTLTSNGKLGKSRVLASKFNGIRKIYKIKTRNREIKATNNHPFLVLTRQQPTRVKITGSGRKKLDRKLKRGDLKVISKKLKKNVRILYNGLYPKCPHLLEEYELEFVFKFLGLKLENKDYIKKQTKFERPIIKLVWRQLKDLKKGDLIVVLREMYDEGQPIKLLKPPKDPVKDKTILPEYTSSEFCQMFGYLLGNSSITINKKGSRIYLCPSEDDEKKAYSKLFFKLFNYKLKKQDKESYEYLYCCSYKVAWLLKKLGLNKRAFNKTIPNWIFTLPRDQKLSFVRGYLDSDGWVNKNGSTCFASSSKKLITKLKLLLDSLGFTTGHVLYRKVKNHWKISKKKESDQWLLTLSNPNKVLKEIGTEKKIYKKRLGKERKGLKFKFSKTITTELPLDLSRFRFDRIKGIEFNGYEPVYDLMIENSHNFIANNIVVHNSIIVDDIEDSSEERRGEKALHLIYGEDIAINAGNALYYLSVLPLVKNKEKFDPKTLLKIYDVYSKEMMRVHLGQAMDIAWHKGLANANDITEDEYLEMCSNKTGCIARLSAKIAAIVAGKSDEEVKKIGKFTETVGIAFQIQDDILNLSGKEFAKGKGGLGEDITEGKRSLPVIHALQKADEKDRKRLIEILGMHTADQKLRNEAIEIIKKYNGIEYAKERARKMVKDAWEGIDKILPESDAKKKLRAFADYLVERKI